MKHSKDESLPKIERIRKNKEFDYILKHGNCKKSRNLTIFYILNEKRAIGFIISRKIKKAVVRNKLKRRLRDIYRRNKSYFNGKYVIIAHPQAKDLSYKELEEEILSLLNKER